MMKRRRNQRVWSRGREALVAASCVAGLAWLTSCAADLMDEGQEDEQGIAGDADEAGESEDMPAGEQGGAAVEATDDVAVGAGVIEAEAESSADRGEPVAEAACVSYGRPCASSEACCDDMVCAFDGYARYCRH